MNYETILKLKEAGYPLQEHSELTTRDSILLDGIMFDFPTLSELIEAIPKDVFDALINIGIDGWSCRSFARSNNVQSYGAQIACSGATPVEAVANLWLALNKK